MTVVSDKPVCEAGVLNASVGKYWTHEGHCGVPGRHVHYGENVVLPVPNELSPLLSELRAENQRLRNEQATLEHTNQWQASEIDRLQLALNGCARAVERRNTEIDRLRDALLDILDHTNEYREGIAVIASAALASASANLA